MFDSEKPGFEIVSPIYIDQFLQKFYVLVPGGYASKRTITRYRKLAGCPNVTRTDREKIELLLTCLLYRPSKKVTEKGLKFLRDKREPEIVRMFKQVTSSMRLEFVGDVKGSDLRSAIFTMTGIHLRTDRTLRNYAKVLSAKTGKNVYFDPAAIYKAEVVNAFAHLAINGKIGQSVGGLNGARKRWKSAA